MFLHHKEYQSSFEKAVAYAVGEHCAEAFIGNADMVKCARM